MTTDQWDHAIIAALIGGIVTLVGTFLTYRIRLKRADLDYWEKLQDAQRKFQGDIHSELDAVKQEREQLRQRIDELETKVRDLVRQNENLIMEKIEWMHKATSLQLLLQKAMQSFELNTNEPLQSWLKSEVEKLEDEVTRESSDDQAH